ncbi:hypothetical protein ETAA8_63240 [Anatilimnocola aggregata]|uniref:Putative zinc-finger domain-containing protein n=1 Tax=Anatilimnocola aggregata TaxID=2528021 RepID=A0A517YLS9_9BACT|nr:zf-HC2 domain-containing protein [Anatilimnocola aggregata]QDU31171.1 hypothetical protein ETAA8_63240 [Anatilimnocola aggregata]
MNCADFQHQLTAWLASETDDGQASELEAHVSDCADCQALLAGVSHDDPLLRSALTDQAATQRVAQRATAGLVEAKALTSGLDLPWQAWALVLLATAAGYFLALALPLQRRPAKLEMPPVVKVPEIPQVEPPVAHLVAATGRVERFDDVQQDWIAVDPKIKYFACPSDSRLRTTSNVQCELKTEDGSVIRLNDQTEVKLLGSSSIQLNQGQVWCRSPGEASLEVRVASTSQPGSSVALGGPQSTLWCVGPSCVMTGIRESGQVQVVNAAGEIKVSTASGQQQLKPGQVAEISNGQVSTPANHVDPLTSTRWMQPLMLARGPDNAELNERVNTLLALIGRAKISTLYEQEIRALGEHAVLPLVRFIQSPLAASDPMRRSAAMRLTADLAPVWLIPDLIDLLADREAYVRQLAAATLYRLTALNMNCSPDQWQAEPDELQTTALADWRAWWAAHRDQYPTHRLRVTEE